MIHSYALSLFTTLVVSKNAKANTLGWWMSYVGLCSPSQPRPAAAAPGQLPAAKTQLPAATTQLPAATTQLPAATASLPAATAQLPAAAAQLPAATAQLPAATAQLTAATAPGFNVNLQVVRECQTHPLTLPLPPGCEPTGLNLSITELCIVASL